MTHSNRYRGLKPNPQALGVTPLMPSEVSQVTRLRGEAEAVQWFQGLTAEQRGDIVAQLHDLTYSLAPNSQEQPGEEQAGGIVQLNLKVSPDLRTALRAKALRLGVPLTEALRPILQAWATK